MPTIKFGGNQFQLFQQQNLYIATESKIALTTLLNKNGIFNQSNASIFKINPSEIDNVCCKAKQEYLDSSPYPLLYVYHLRVVLIEI